MEEKMIFCPECGQKQSSSNKFCIKCGAKIPPVKSPEPEFVPTPEPEQAPTPAPEYVPTSEPEQAPTPAPEYVPTPEPEQVPTPAPEYVPTPAPEYVPTPAPEYVPTPEPEQVPTPTPEQVPTYTPPLYAQSAGGRPPETPYMQNPVYDPNPGQNAPAPKKKRGNKVVLTIVIILAALLLVGGGGLLGAYLGGAFDSYQSGSGNDDEDEDKNKDKDKDKNKDEETGEDEETGGDTSDVETDENGGDDTGVVTEPAVTETEPAETDAPVVEVPKPYYTIDDFAAFAKGEATLKSTEDLGTYTRYTYTLPEDAFFYIVGEYGVGVMSFPDLSDESEWTSPDGKEEYFSMKYAGEGEAEPFDDLEKGFRGIVFEMGFSYDSYDAVICLAKGIEFVDKGARTRFTRDVSSLEIELGGVLYDDMGPSPWVPVGYSMQIGFEGTTADGTIINVEPVVDISDPNVLRYDRGSSRIVAVGPGRATLTAQVGNAMDTYTIEVYDVKDIGNRVALSPEEVDLDFLDGDALFTTTVTFDVNEGGDMLSFDVLAAPGVEVYDIGEWNGLSVEITFRFHTEAFDLNEYDILAVFCGFVYYQDQGLNRSTDLCTVAALCLS